MISEFRNMRTAQQYFTGFVFVRSLEHEENGKVASNGSVSKRKSK